MNNAAEILARFPRPLTNVERCNKLLALAQAEFYRAKAEVEESRAYAIDAKAGDEVAMVQARSSIASAEHFEAMGNRLLDEAKAIQL